MEKQTLKIGLAQFAPVWMNRQKTLEKALRYADVDCNAPLTRQIAKGLQIAAFDPDGLI